MTTNPNSGLVTLRSSHSVDETLKKLQEILRRKGIIVFALIDHSGVALQTGLQMPNTKLILFGNAAAGTPIMIACPSAANPAGGIFVGFWDGDLGEYLDGRWRIHLSRGTNHASVYTVVGAPGGGVLGATSAGLVGWREGKETNLSSDNGLPCNGIHSLVFDASKVLWLYTACGVIGIEHVDMQRWWGRLESKVNLTKLDVLDGAQPARADFSPGASLSPDGTVWFANATALQEFDPLRIPKNAVLPPVYIEDIIADGKNYPAQREFRMPPLTPSSSQASHGTDSATPGCAA